MYIQAVASAPRGYNLVHPLASINNLAGLLLKNW